MNYALLPKSNNPRLTFSFYVPAPLSSENFQKCFNVFWDEVYRGFWVIRPAFFYYMRKTLLEEQQNSQECQGEIEKIDLHTLYQNTSECDKDYFFDSFVENYAPIFDSASVGKSLFCWIDDKVLSPSFVSEQQLTIWLERYFNKNEFIPV